MNGFSLLLMAASLGVTYTWRAGIDQQQEYVLQIEPEIVQALAAGEEIFSDLPSDAGPFQRLCIMVLAKDGAAVRHTAAADEQFRQLLVSAGRYASREPARVAADPVPTLLWPGRAGSTPEQTYGVTTGWQPDKSGNQQYLVQIDPTVLSTLALGDELYIPIDSAAGRPVRFVVKSGRENLPRIGGRPTATQPPVSLTQTNPSASSRNRYNTSSDSTTGWMGGATATDPRQPNRYGSSVTDHAFGDNHPANQYGTAPYGATSAPTVPPASAYPGYGSPSGTAPSNFDQYRSPANVGPPPLSHAGYATQPAAGQQPQLPPSSRQFQPQYLEARVAALPPPPVATTALNPGAISPSAVVAPQQDKPWGPLLFVTFALFFSIGGNLYLAWTALDFHGRYRNAIERLRSAARSA